MTTFRLYRGDELIQEVSDPDYSTALRLVSHLATVHASFDCPLLIKQVVGEEMEMFMGKVEGAQAPHAPSALSGGHPVFTGPMGYVPPEEHPAATEEVAEKILECDNGQLSGRCTDQCDECPLSAPDPWVMNAQLHAAVRSLTLDLRTQRALFDTAMGLLHELVHLRHVVKPDPNRQAEYEANKQEVWRQVCLFCEEAQL